LARTRLFGIKLLCTLVALSDAIVDILHAGLLGRDNSSTSVQLSPSDLEKIIGIIRDELKNSTNVVCVGCRKASFSSVAIKLLRLVTNWTRLCDPLSPSSFITWPAFSSRTSRFSSSLPIAPDSAQVLRRFHFASSWLPNSEPFLINGSGEVSSSSPATAAAHPKYPLQPGILTSFWFQPPYTTNFQATPSVCDLEFVNMAELGELVHLFTLESISTCQLHFSQNIELCSPDWAFQVWFCVPYSMFYLRVSHRVCSSDTASSSEDASCSVREWSTWIPFSCGRSTEIPLWHHALFQMSQKTESSITVYLIVDGCFEHSTDVVSCQFKKFPVNKLETAFLSTHPSTGTFLHFGHNSGHPFQPHKVAIGCIFFFEEKEDMFQSPVFDAHQLGLILTLLGPDWNGHFDSLECGARYSNMAWCILRSLVRRLFHEDVEENRVGAFFFEASNLISSSKWFHPARLLVQSSLFLIVLTEPSLRVLFRQQEQLPAASSDNLEPPSPSCDSDHTEISSHLFRLDSKSPKWLSELAHVFLMYHPISGAFEETSQRTDLHTIGKSGNQVSIVPITVTSQRKINIDHAFDPHGGLDVVLYLLGVAVSNETGLLNNATDLQATLLDLLFSLLNGSASMSAYFGAPALSDPGTERFIAKRRRRVAYRQAVQPLSVGDCFFARLIKHPKFNATSPQVTEVLLNQLFAFKEQSTIETAEGIPVASSPALLIDPGLLRCFIAFGVQAFWCPISCFGEQCPEDLQKHLIPRAFDLVYLTLSASSSTCSSLTACLIDRWQLLSVAFSAFREIFLRSQVQCPLPLDTLAVILAPLLILSVRRLTRCDTNAQSSAECKGVWSGDTELRMLFDGLCRLVIALDADMFLVAAEHVFSTISDQSPSYGSIPSETEILDSTWIWWHKLTACCIRPERWLIWMSGATETNIQSNPPFSPASTRRSLFEQSEQQHAASTRNFVPETATLNFQQHLKNDASDLIQSTPPSEEEPTATELEVITRYVDALDNELERTHSMQSKLEGDSIETKSLTRSDLGSMEQLALRMPDEETQPSKEPLVISPNPLDIITGPPCKDQLDAILGHLLEPSMLGHHSSHRSVSDYPPTSDSAREHLSMQLGALSPQDGAASESERNQMLAFAIVCALDYIWSSLLDAPYGTEARCNTGTNPTLFGRLAEQLASTVSISVDQSTQQRLSSILRPPIWLVHSLLGHPCVHIREAGMNAYRVWLKHSRRPSPSQLSDLLIAQLLNFSPSFQAVDLKFRTRSSYRYRHLCSPTLLDRAFAMVFDGIVLSDTRNSSHSKTTRGVSKTSQTLLDYLCRSDLSKIVVSQDQVPQEAKEQESDPVTHYISSNTPPTVAHLKLPLTFLLAIILGGFADAVMSISVESIESAPMVTTSEIELCADAVTALTNLLQFESSCLMPNALRAGLLPVLYNLAWILETAVQKQDMSFEKHPGSLFVLLTPILGGLCRLFARVIRWILLDATIPSMYVDCSRDLRFKLVTDFIRRLFTMYPGEKEISPSQAPIFNPGPVSCCLVRRIFYSLLDVLIQQLDSAGRDSMQTMEERFGEIRGSGAIKRLFEQLEWTVNNAVCMLTCPDVTSTHRDFRAETDQMRFTIDNPYSDLSTRANNSAVEVPHLITPDYALSGTEQAENQRAACYNPQSNNTRENLQRSLDQALVTAMFTSALNIQNGSLFHFSHTQPNCLSATDCLTMFCKALGRMLVTKTQPPVANVALDPTVNYLLRLFNEEPMLLRSCLNSLPRSFSLVFWGNLAELGSWLDTFVSSESDWHSIPSKTAMASPAASSTRSSSGSCQSVNFSDKLVQRQLEQLSRTVQSLIAVQAHISPFLQTTGQSSDFTSSPAMIDKHRGLLISAQAKAHAQWSASMLLSPEVSAANGVPQAKNKSKEQLPALVNLLLQSFGSGLIPPRDSMGAILKSHPVSSPTGKFSRRISTARLASQAHRRCIEGHRAWKEAFGERLRIAGPLSTLLWARLADRLDHPSGIFYDPDSAPCVRCVDPLEGPMRQRRRMFYMHLPLADRLVHSEKRNILAHRRLPHPLASLIGLPSRIPKPSTGAACQWTHLPLFLPLPATPLVQLASASRHDALGVWACRLVGLVHIPPVEGDLILGDSWLRFQPDSSEFVTATAEEDSLFRVNPVARLWLAWPLSSIDHVEKRRYALRKLAVEIFPDGTSVNAPALFAMRSNKDRNHFIRTLREQMKTKTVRRQFLSTTSEEHPFGDESNFDHGHHRLRAVQRRWLKGQISNFAYLMELNDLAGRTYNDLMQYPIFPWVIQDYESAVLDLGHPNTYRKFDRPIAVQLDERAAAVSKHYDDAEQFAETLLSEFSGSVEKLSIGGTRISPKFAGLIYPPYHYPSHCSNEAIVLNFMVRLLPYTYRHLRFQDNNYDVPDRSFHSIEATWRLATTTVTCVKELLPELYFVPELFVNDTGLALGSRQNGSSVDSVQLPPWSKGNPRFFTLICRAALESDYTTSQISHWIDLIFGYKQNGKRAKEALNLYHPYTYFGAIDVDQIQDPIRAQAVEAMISNYGQTPKQLFKRRPHPSRFILGVMHADQIIASPSVECDPCTSVECHQHPIGMDRFENMAHVNRDDLDKSADAEFLQNSSKPFEITPLETVIGLRWGKWAGSPQSPRLQVMWKVNASQFRNPSQATKFGHLHTEPSISHLCAAVWSEACSCTSAMFDNTDSPTELMYTLKTLREAWNGFVQTTHSSINETFQSATRDIHEHSPMEGQDARLHWRWSILGCERLARIWLTSRITNDGARLFLVKLFCSPVDQRTLHLRVKDLLTSESSGENVILTLPVVNPSMKITALAVSQASRTRMQLYVGTSNGSVYVRRCPMELSEISNSGWFPKDFAESFVNDSQKTSTNLLGDTSHPRTSSQQTTSGHATQTCNEAGLWEVTGWRQLSGHAGKEITTLAACQQYGLLASGDNRGGLCLWDTHRLTLLCRLNTFGNSESYPPETHIRDILLSGQDNDEGCSEVHSGRSPPRYQVGAASEKDGEHYALRCAYNQIDGLCFSPTSGDLAVACWSESGLHACWIGVYSASGTQVVTRLLDFMAEITDEEPRREPVLSQNNSTRPTIPMAYSTVSEGHGVNCLLLGGTCGRLVWLNSWTLDTVRTMLVSQDRFPTGFYVLAFYATPR
ncbi:Lysosomal-trafficking regulator, partial [Clonorchis sinensis]